MVTIRSLDGDGIGSGVLFARQRPNNKDQIEYIVVTDNHVLEGVKDFELTLYGAEESDNCYVGSKGTELYGKDALSDLAVIGIKEGNYCYRKDYKSFELDEGKTDTKAGNFVIAIGAPLGHQETATFGIVSAVNRTWDGYLARFIQTDAPINPGNSGGALIDMNGNLLGINTFIDFDSRGRDGLGFALERRFVIPIVNQLIHHKNVERVDLGIRLEDNCYIFRYNNEGLSSNDTGCLGPAVYSDVGELKKGDMIIFVNDQPVYDPIDFWTEASLVTRTDSEVKVSYISEKDFKLQKYHRRETFIRNLSLMDGFSIQVKYLPDIISRMIGGVPYPIERLYLQEVRTECSSIGETEPCGLRIEHENRVDGYIVRFTDTPIQNLSHFINSVETRSKMIIESANELGYIKSVFGNCATNDKSSNGETAALEMKDMCKAIIEESSQELERLQDISIEVRHADGERSTKRFTWYSGGLSIFP